MSNLLKRIIGNVTTRIMFIIYLSIIAISLFFIVFGYFNQLQLHEKKEYEILKAMASSLAISIDGDQHERMMKNNEWFEQIKSVDQDKDYYDIHKHLNEAHTTNGLSNPMYTLVYEEDAEVFYFGVRSDTNVYFRHKYEMFSDSLLTLMETGGTIPRYETENGEWLSAFHPIRNREGKVVALLEADIDFGHFRKLVNQQYSRQALISAIVILLMAVVLIPYARKILKEDEELKRAVYEQKLIIESKNRDLTDSINYARKIQESILPSKQEIKENFPDCLLFFKPRDIVSGDFYWLDKSKGITLLAAADCTGHGIPGALMSMIGHSQLNTVLQEKNPTNPGHLLDLLDIQITRTLSSKKYTTQSKDGMDIAVVSYEKDKNVLNYSGAFRPLVKINGDKIEEIKANRFPIGGGESYEKTKFDNHEINIQPGDKFYMFSDGFPDQFGGDKEKKYMNKKFKEFLHGISHLPSSEQEEKLASELKSWQGDNEQVDDILVIGLLF